MNDHNELEKLQKENTNLRAAILGVPLAEELDKEEFLKHRLPRTWEVLSRIYTLANVSASDKGLIMDEVVRLTLEVLTGKRPCNQYETVYQQELSNKVDSAQIISIFRAADQLLFEENGAGTPWKDPRPDKARNLLENAQSEMRQAKHWLLNDIPKEEAAIRAAFEAQLTALEDKKLGHLRTYTNMESMLPNLEEGIKKAEQRAQRLISYNSQLESQRRSHVSAKLEAKATLARQNAEIEASNAQRRAEQDANDREAEKAKLAEWLKEHAGETND